MIDVLNARCAGFDVHKKTIKVCLLLKQADGKECREIRTYGMITHELLSLSDWLKEQGCTHIAMEATGVYWKPVYNLLEGNFELIVANAQLIYAVPGRKTDVNDAQWIAMLLQLGLLKPSFIPAAPQRELRKLTRYRVRLTEERSARGKPSAEDLGRCEYQTGGCGERRNGESLTDDPCKNCRWRE